MFNTARLRYFSVPSSSSSNRWHLPSKKENQGVYLRQNLNFLLKNQIQLLEPRPFLNPFESVAFAFKRKILFDLIWKFQISKCMPNEKSSCDYISTTKKYFLTFFLQNQLLKLRPFWNLIELVAFVLYIIYTEFNSEVFNSNQDWCGDWPRCNSD